MLNTWDDTSHCSKTGDFKELLKQSYKDHLIEHFLINNQEDWINAKQSLIDDVDKFSIVGVAVKTGKRLIGKPHIT